MLCKKHKRRTKTWIYKHYFEKIKNNKWVFFAKKGNQKLYLFQIPYVEIKRHMICKNLNAYDPANIDYFTKRNANHSKNVLLSGKTKSALAKTQKGYCPVCNESLFNHENLEIHYVKPRSKKGDHQLKNLKLLHKLCHKQIEYSNNTNLRAVWLKQGILALNLT